MGPNTKARPRKPATQKREEKARAEERWALLANDGSSGAIDLGQFHANLTVRESANAIGMVMAGHLSPPAISIIGDGIETQLEAIRSSEPLVPDVDHGLAEEEVNILDSWLDCSSGDVGNYDGFCHDFSALPEPKSLTPVQENVQITFAENIDMGEPPLLPTVSETQTQPTLTDSSNTATETSHALTGVGNEQLQSWLDFDFELPPVLSDFDQNIKENPFKVPNDPVGESTSLSNKIVHSVHPEYKGLREEPSDWNDSRAQASQTPSSIHTSSSNELPKSEAPQSIPQPGGPKGIGIGPSSSRQRSQSSSATVEQNKSPRISASSFAISNDVSAPARAIATLERRPFSRANPKHTKNTAYSPLVAPNPFDVFEYSKDGELEPSGAYSPEEVHRYLWQNPVHDGVPDLKSSPFTLRIARCPSGSSDRFPTTTSFKCKFESCPMDSGTINQGHVFVLFDEYHVTQPNHDPFINAGYVHLYCLERFCDFPNICAKFDVCPDRRTFSKEAGSRNKFSLATRAEEKAVEDFVKMCSDGQVPLDYPKLVQQNRAYEGTLCHKLALIKLANMPQNHHIQFQRRESIANYKGATLPYHKGDLEKEAERRFVTRQHKNQNQRTIKPRQERIFRNEGDESKSGTENGDDDDNRVAHDRKNDEARSRYVAPIAKMTGQTHSKQQSRAKRARDEPGHPTITSPQWSQQTPRRAIEEERRTKNQPQNMTIPSNTLSPPNTTLSSTPPQRHPSNSPLPPTSLSTFALPQHPTQPADSEGNEMTEPDHDTTTTELLELRKLELLRNKIQAEQRQIEIELELIEVHKVAERRRVMMKRRREEGEGENADERGRVKR